MAQCSVRLLQPLSSKEYISVNDEISTYQIITIKLNVSYDYKKVNNVTPSYDYFFKKFFFLLT